jgi:hypothetical protein
MRMHAVSRPPAQRDARRWLTTDSPSTDKMGPRLADPSNERGNTGQPCPRPARSPFCRLAPLGPSTALTVCRLVSGRASIGWAGWSGTKPTSTPQQRSQPLSTPSHRQHLRRTTRRDRGTSRQASSTSLARPSRRKASQIGTPDSTNRSTSMASGLPGRIVKLTRTPHRSNPSRQPPSARTFGVECIPKVLRPAAVPPRFWRGPATDRPVPPI